MKDKKSYFIHQALLFLFSIKEIPLIAFLSPKVVQLDDEICIIKIPLTRRSRNHLNSMYFGALSVGADLVVGLPAYENIRQSGEKVQFVFKSFHADFLSRPNSDVFFQCDEVGKIHQLVEKCIQSEDRETQVFSAYAYTDQKLKNPVAKFELGLSVKKRLPS